ncbi:hypothetical protein [Novosphingobium piscinae]|uniref:hypothetical protein n=1 Tax=Novosphingobium piscinae TaxID=1507448 RepID=UPI00163A022F|nr:hypothetical protein [Novosphingobium piscinae]
MTVVTRIEAETEGQDILSLSPRAVLVLPQARAALLQHTHDAGGAPLLTLFIRDQEISWDDPRHFALAEALTAGLPLAAGELATRSGLDWAEARPMLADLLQAGILVRADACPVAAERHHNQPMPSPLPPAPLDRARSWMDAESLMRELTGSEIDLAWLETVVPVFRTAHLFLDRDGRHVGEANAFPAAARTEVPTEWRGCPYPGNRYQPDKPMNMTALKAMRAQWRQMMGLLGPIREAYLRRFPEARQGWTVAHVERLTVCVLALPSYLMLRFDRPTANGDLHPALSNLFRVTDGLRMTMHHMLFVPLFEPMHAPDAPVTPEHILAYAERNFLFHSEHGVCAGPRFMIEDFLAVLLDGAAPRSGFDAMIDPELAAALDLLEPALDYGLLGLQTFGTVFTLWPAMARCYARLHEVLAGGTRPVAAAMAERFVGHFDALSHRSFLASEDWRTHREAVYDDMFAACARGVAGDWPELPLSLQIGGAGAIDPAAQLALAAAAAEHFGADSGALAAEFAGIVGDFLGRAQRILGLAETIQTRLGRLLHRPAPGRALSLQDLNRYHVLMGADQRSVPFLPDELHQLLGLTIAVDARSIRIARKPASALPHSPTPVSADIRAQAR